MDAIKKYWHDIVNGRQSQVKWLDKKFLLAEKRKVNIVQIKVNGITNQRLRYDEREEIRYLLHCKFLMKQEHKFYIEECILPYVFIRDGKSTVHRSLQKFNNYYKGDQLHLQERRDHFHRDSKYNRREAVLYAERWWNNYNPDYKIFRNDCTNYISQCLHAGGAPMWGAPKRDTGWWYNNKDWSYSWSLSHSMRWYLSGSSMGLIGVEVESPEKLLPGDVICYDFEGDNRWDHTTIVVAKDERDMPLVNAHTNSSRHRYWSYEDSLAWTPKIKYKFFKIIVK